MSNKPGDYTDFVFQQPFDGYLKQIIDNYFYIHLPVADIKMRTEYIIPFPRVTFGYFFNAPYTVINLSTHELQTLTSAISRISFSRLAVKPVTDHIKIVGAHLRPYALSYFTSQVVSKLPFVINPILLWGKKMETFMKETDNCQTVSDLFNLLETTFLDVILKRKIEPVIQATNLIDSSLGEIRVSEVAEKLKVTDRTLRNYFFLHMGCSHKEYIKLLKLKQSLFRMSNTKNPLTDIGYHSNYFDQAHFIHAFQKIVGKSPGEIRKDLPAFRFLQF